MSERKVTSLEVDKDLWSKVKIRAAELKMTRADLVETSLKNFLSLTEKKAK